MQKKHYQLHLLDIKIIIVIHDFHLHLVELLGEGKDWQILNNNSNPFVVESPSFVFDRSKFVNYYKLGLFIKCEV